MQNTIVKPPGFWPTSSHGRQSGASAASKANYGPLSRLIKAAFTFTGGADYLAWKIERHSGQKVELSDWQKRHPIIASLTLLPKLLKSGAVR